MFADRLEALRAEIEADPAGIGYAAMLPDAPGHIVEALNARTQMAAQSRFVTARTLLAELDDGPDVLDALEAAAQQISAVKWAMEFLRTEGGIDVGHPATAAMLDLLAMAAVLTRKQADSIKALALQPASRAEVLGLGAVSEADLREAGVI